MENLPNLTAKQHNFVVEFIKFKFVLMEDGAATKAYRAAYDCSKMNNDTVNNEASKLLNHPKITPWIEHYKKNLYQVKGDDEIKYLKQDCQDELDDIKTRALNAAQGKQTASNLSVAGRMVELKGKLNGHFTDKVQVSGEKLSDVLGQLT